MDQIEMKKYKWECISTNQEDEICRWLNRLQERGDVVDVKFLMHGYRIVVFAKVETVAERRGML